MTSDFCPRCQTRLGIPVLSERVALARSGDEVQERCPRCESLVVWREDIGGWAVDHDAEHKRLMTEGLAG